MNKNDFLSKLKSNNGDYSEFEKYLEPSSTVLDYQAGYGRDSLYFNDKYDVSAINLDPRLASELSKNVKKSFCVDIRESHFMNRFNAIWVYESFNDHDADLIKEVLDVMYIALKKDGVIQVNMTLDKINEFNFDNMCLERHFEILSKDEVARTNLVNPHANFRYILKRGSLLSK